MPPTLPQLRHRIKELDQLAAEVYALAEKSEQESELSVKGQQWYRGVRELMVQIDFSGLSEFEECYIHYPQKDVPGAKHIRSRSDIETYFSGGGREGNFEAFKRLFLKARALASALEAEVLSRQLRITSQLSLMVAANELENAENILRASNGHDSLVRASGVIARVALERHLFTVAESHRLTIAVNPPNKRKPDVEDVMQTLLKNGVITAIQKSHLDALFKVANYCAHPKEQVNATDVDRLIRDGRQLSSVIL